MCNNVRVVSRFHFQPAHAFSTEKPHKEAAEASSANENAEVKRDTAVAKYDYDEHDDYDYEEPKTASQKVFAPVIQSMKPERLF